MSTKSSISHSEEHHLYRECFENNNVHLTLDNVKNLKVYTYENMKKGVVTSATMSIPIDIWRQIVKEWLECNWANNPSLDNHDPFS